MSSKRRLGLSTKRRRKRRRDSSELDETPCASAAVVPAKQLLWNFLQTRSNLLATETHLLWHWYHLAVSCSLAAVPSQDIPQLVVHGNGAQALYSLLIETNIHTSLLKHANHKDIAQWLYGDTNNPARLLSTNTRLILVRDRLLFCVLIGPELTKRRLQEPEPTSCPVCHEQSQGPEWFMNLRARLLLRLRPD